ncbi:MAG TPA: phosphoribosylformylglycinamidine synthase subunit PurS [Chloroflexota bacterium]|nr:phosphoribosylformylglycinamidine synthase subunit PurS [Chloroflexota bacterium]
MSGFLARVYVSPRPSVRDPEGSTILDGLHQLGFGTVEIVRAGKYFEILLEAGSGQIAEEQLDLMCRKLLANPVVEQYRFDLQVESSVE